MIREDTILGPLLETVKFEAGMISANSKQVAANGRVCEYVHRQRAERIAKFG